MDYRPLGLLTFFVLALACPPAKAACAPPSVPAVKASRVHGKAATTSTCVNLDAIPTISTSIVADEERGQPVTRYPADSAPPAAKPYTGPTLGLSPMVRRAPTVGYRWSLD